MIEEVKKKPLAKQEAGEIYRRIKRIGYFIYVRLQGFGCQFFNLFIKALKKYDSYAIVYCKKKASILLRLFNMLYNLIV